MRLYTANEYAELYQIHPKTVYRLGREGRIKSVRVGRSVRFAEMERSEDVKREVENETVV